MSEGRWEEIPGTVIAHCRDSAGLLHTHTSDEVQNQAVTDIETAENAELGSVINNLVPTCTQMSIENILNSDDVEVHENVTDFTMASAVVEAHGRDSESESEGKDVDADDCAISVNEAERAIRTALRISEMQPVLNLRLQRDLRCLLSAQRRRKADRMHQTSIDSYFQK